MARSHQTANGVGPVKTEAQYPPPTIDADGKIRPWWIDKHPREWPPEARIAFLLLAEAAERRLADMQSRAQADTRSVEGKK